MRYLFLILAGVLNAAPVKEVRYNVISIDDVPMSRMADLADHIVPTGFPIDKGLDIKHLLTAQELSTSLVGIHNYVAEVQMTHVSWDNEKRVFVVDIATEKSDSYYSALHRVVRVRAIYRTPRNQQLVVSTLEKLKSKSVADILKDFDGLPR